MADTMLSKGGTKYPVAMIAKPVTKVTLAAIAGTRREIMPTSTTAKIGMKYIPFIFCKYPKMLVV